MLFKVKNSNGLKNALQFILQLLILIKSIFLSKINTNLSNDDNNNEKD